MCDCPGVGGRNYAVECGVVRWGRFGPMGSEWVISHIVTRLSSASVHPHFTRGLSHLWFTHTFARLVCSHYKFGITSCQCSNVLWIVNAIELMFPEFSTRVCINHASGTGRGRIINHVAAPYTQKWLTDMMLNENPVFIPCKVNGSVYFMPGRCGVSWCHRRRTLVLGLINAGTVTGNNAYDYVWETTLGMQLLIFNIAICMPVKLMLSSVNDWTSPTTLISGRTHAV